MADISAFLSPQDRAKLARSIGIPLGDGRVFKGRRITSEEDAQRSAMDRQRNSLLTQQTAGYRASQEMLQREQARMGQPSPQFLPPAGAPAPQPGTAPTQPQGQAPAPHGVPSPILLAKANQIARYQAAQANQPAPNLPPMPGQEAAQPASPAPAPSPAFLQPQGQILVNGQPYTPPSTPLAPPLSEQNMMLGTALARQDMRQEAAMRPKTNLVDRTYSPQEIARMTPEQLMSREAFDQQNFARKQQQEQTALEAAKTRSEIAKNTAPKDQVYASETEARKAGEAANPGLTVKVEPAAGGFSYSAVQGSPRAYPSPDEVASSEAQKGVIGRLNKQVEDESAYAANAQQTLEEINATRTALNEGGMVGVGQNAIDAAIGAFARLPGAGEYFGGLKGKQDVLKRGFASFAVDAAQRIAGQGQITEKERELVANTVPQKTDSGPAVRFGLDFAQAALQRRQKYAQLIEDTQARLASGEINATEASKITNKTKFYQENPIDVKKIYQDALKTQAPKKTEQQGADIEAILNKYR